MISEKLKNVHYNSALRFANLLTEEQREGLTVEQYAKKDTEEWAERMEKLAEQEANELVYDIRTGKCLGKRKDLLDT